MRTSRVRVVFLGVLAAGWALACDDNPVDEDRQDGAGLQVNPTFAIVDAGGTTGITAVVVNQFGDATLDPVTFTACDAMVAVELDPDRVRVQPPDRVLVTGADTLGVSCVDIAGAGFSTQTDVRIIPAGLRVVSGLDPVPPGATSIDTDTVRAGATGEIVVEAISRTGAAVNPFDRGDTLDVRYAVSSAVANPGFRGSADAQIVTITSDSAAVSTEKAGVATVTATWSVGAPRSVDHGILVQPEVPASAEFEEDAFGLMTAGDSAKLEVVVLDVFGNKNTFVDELLGVVAQSSDNTVATVRADVDTLLEGADTVGVNVIVTAFAQGGGVANVTGTVTTSAGDFPFGPAEAPVAAPLVALVAPATGPVGTDVVITGTGLTLPGITTTVTVGGESADEFVSSLSATSISLQIPNAGTAGAHDLVVDVGGVAADTATWTQQGDDDASDPANDDPSTAPTVILPFNDVASFQGGDADDFFSFTLTTTATVVIDLEWNAGKDLDVIVQPKAIAVPADGTFQAYDNDVCGNSGATGDKPQQAVCTDLAAGDYVIHVIDFDSFFSGDVGLVSYEVTAQIQ